jgi:alpha-2-macroglobulin
MKPHHTTGRRNRSRLHGAWLLPVALLVAACPSKPPATPVGLKPPPSKSAPPEHVDWKVSKSGLGFRLSDADPEPPPRPKLAPSKPLAPEETARLIARLPAMKASAEPKAFALRDKSRPAPRPGETLKTAFPPPIPGPAPPAPTAPGTPASLVRWAPEGPIEVAPNLSLTFSEPMVAVTSHDELAASQVPARLSPQPAGRWRWVGTQTLLFEPKDERFPKATDYRVEIPAGTLTAAGRTLGEAKSFGFALPVVKVEHFQPNRYTPVELEPILFARFDQRIDKNALLSHVELATDGGGAKSTRLPLRLASEDEIEKNADVRRAVQHAESDRILAFRAVDPLPKATRFQVNFKRGLPSAEGPKTTESDQTFDFRTYDLFKLSHVDCGWYEGCPPLAAWRVNFTNPIDTGKFDRALVTVEPALPGMKVSVAGSTIGIHGRSKGRTKYTVRIGAGLTDKFGQTLGAPAAGTVEVDAAEPMLFPEERDMVVLDPAFEPTLSVYSVNRSTLKVRLYAVGPEHFAKYQKFRQDWDYDGRLTQPPGTLIATHTVKPERKVDELVETRIPLAPGLKDGVGQVLAIVEPPVQKPKKNRWDHREREWVRSWVQVTKLGLQAFKDPTHVNGWITRLSDGAPVDGAELGVLIDGAPVPRTPSNVRSRPDGIAELALGPGGSTVFARLGADLVFLPSGNITAFAAHSRSDRLMWFVMDDRRLYKPGERVHAKGWLRIANAGKKGDVAGLPRRGPHRVSYNVTDGRNNKLTNGMAPVDDDGGFHLSFDLPKNANLGNGVLALELQGPAGNHPGRHHLHAFMVEEFRRPEFEVAAETTEGPHFVGKHAIATVTASYYAGGSLPDSEVKWRVQADDAEFSPPNRAGFHFGKPRQISWWAKPDTKRKADENWEAKTTGGGQHRLRIDFEALDPAYPRKLDLEASVTDVNRQSWTARSSVLVHPASVTVGLRPESTLPTAGQNLQLDLLVTDIEGKAVAGRAVSVTAARIESTWRGDEVEQFERDVKTCNVVSTNEVARCAFPTANGGLHRLTAVVTDEHGRKSTSRVDVWVLGGDYPMEQGVRRGQVDVVPDKVDYSGGDEVKLLVMAPFAPAEGVLTLEREGVVELKRFRLEQRTGTISVRLDPAWVPGVFASVRLVGAAVRENDAGNPDPSLPKRPAYANGGTKLDLPPRDRALKIGLTPRPKALDPGATTQIGIDVADASGKPAPGSIVTLVVVDEAVLALAGYEPPDPLELFYARRAPDVAAHETHDLVVLGKPDLSRMRLEAKKNGKSKEATVSGRVAGGMGYGSGSGSYGVARASASAAPRAPSPKKAMADDKPGDARLDSVKKKITIHEVTIEEEATTPIKVRSEFSALAAFLPRVTVDARGHAEAKVKLPDSLTRYRIIAVAAANQNQFGTAESDVTARLPLMARPSAPRFLNYGDKVQLPVVLQNQTADPMTVDVALRVDNLRLLDPNGQRVVVPAADRVELRFPLAAVEAGTARIQVGIAGRAHTAADKARVATTATKPTGRTFADAAELELPVWTPATTEAFATYGVVDQGSIAQPVRMPAGVVKEFGGLEITTSSTALQGLSDAVLYLTRYPFECNEQISSRVMGIAALRDVLGAFEAEGLPKPEALKKTIAADVQKLTDRQHWSGGWDWWRRDREPDPYVSVHVTHALTRAKAKGYRVSDQLMNQALTYLRNIRSKFPPYWPPEARRVVEAYSLDVRRRAGDSDPARARALLKEAGGADQTPIEALGWLLPLLSKDAGSATELAATRRHLDNRVTETAGKAHFVTSYGDNAHLLLHSDRRADGILLESLIEDRPDSDVIPKLVAGLLAHRKRGRWYNTQENVFILLGLDRYFQTYEKATPNFVARAWLGDRFAGEHPFRGRSNDRQHVDIPMSALAELVQPSNVTLAKDGPGRLYFRIGMQYAPANLRPPPAEHGFSVARRYEAVNLPSDVRQDKDRTWRVRAGALVRVRVTMVAPARRYHVALVDPLPAGFEPLNPALATTQSIPQDPEDEPDSPAVKRGAKGSPRARGARGGSPWWWSRAWYEHQNLRDERVEAFSSLLWDGVYDYVYVARATTPGDYVVPPPKAEEMYDPETFGRGAGDRVVVY